jgi:hypothetical protein
VADCVFGFLFRALSFLVAEAILGLKIFSSSRI